MDSDSSTIKSTLFNSKTCSDPSVQKIYDKVCESQSSKDKDKCMAGLTQFCKGNIYTNSDFQMKTKLLNCYVNNNCKGDEVCMKKCEMS